MGFLKKNLKYAAVAAVVAAAALRLGWPGAGTASLVLAGLALVSVAAYFVLNFRELKHGFRRRAFIYSGNLALVVILVLGLVVLADYFTSRHHWRVDFTASKRHSVSDQTINVVKNLKADVHLKCFFREGNYGRQELENLLKIYAYHSGRIKYEFIDPDKNPSLVKRYGVTQDGTTIIEVGERESRITTTSEEDLTNALIKATREKKKILYFLEGHGEGSIDDSGDAGFSTLKAELEKLGYEVKKQTLALSEQFPADADLLVVAGPEKDLLPNELQTVESYINRGGRVMFLVDPETGAALPAFLEKYGFRLANDIVVDTVSRLLGGDYFMPVVSEYETHAVTSRFRYATFYPLARSIEQTDTKPAGAVITELAKTSPNSWSERDLKTSEVRFDKDKDKQGPLTIAAVASFKVKPPDSGSKPEEKPTGAAPANKAGEGEAGARTAGEKEVRLAVVGDSDFLKNRYYGLSGNGNFGANIINWLTEEADLISIQPRTQNPRTINLSPSQMSVMRFVVLYLLPFGTLGLGVYIWLRRRSL